MENRVETEALEVDMGLLEHKVVPNNTRAHHETGILDQYHLWVFHFFVIYRPVDWRWFDLGILNL